jgi:hypothetical protein
MTRDQAIAAVFKVATGDLRKDVPVMIDALEALGLLKLDKDERDEGRRFVKQMARNWFRYATTRDQTFNGGGEALADAIIQDIDSARLKIVSAE